MSRLIAYRADTASAKGRVPSSKVRGSGVGISRTVTRYLGCLVVGRQYGRQPIPRQAECRALREDLQREFHFAERRRNLGSLNERAHALQHLAGDRDALAHAALLRLRA